MSKLKKNQVLLGIGVARTGNGSGEYYCFTARFRPSALPAMESNEAAVENLRRGLRDLHRAVESFGLAADLEGPEWSAYHRIAEGPFALLDGHEFFGNVVLVPADDAAGDKVARHIRAGLNAAAALLRTTGYYRVSIRYKPEEQLSLVDSQNSAANDEADDEELAV